MTPDPKPGEQVRLTDEEFERTAEEGRVSDSGLDVIEAEARRAREGEARGLEVIRELRQKLALAGFEGSPPPGHDTVIGALMVQRDAALKERDAIKAQLDAALARPSSYSSGYDDGFKRSEKVRAEIEAEIDALRSRLEEARAEFLSMRKDRDYHHHGAQQDRATAESLRSDLKAARDRIGALERIGRLERALLDYCRHGEYCTLSQVIPAEDEDKHHCTCGLSAALAPAPGTAPTREVLTPEQAEEMRKEGAALSKEIKRRTAPMKRGPFEPAVPTREETKPREACVCATWNTPCEEHREPRVDPFDMPGKGDWE